MPDDLYDRDILEWSIAQAERLRRLRLGERPNDVDWDNLIEEIESVGRAELHAVHSLAERALEHLIKLAAWPDADPERHWVKEARAFLRALRRRFTPSMRQHVDIASIYAGTRSDVLVERVGGREPASVHADCPFALDELLDPEFDVTRAVTRLSAPSAPAAVRPPN